LVVFGSTLAKKILFNENKEATGVQIEATGVGSGSITYTVNATKEVILSASAFRSPQMLMVSGIGPAATLQSNGIEVLADRPGVGQNMWDHVFFGPSYVVDTVTDNFLGDSAFSAAATKEYIKSRSGILTNVGGDLLGKF
jgi:choline dehydrogenase-like flavoprotein